MSDTQADTQTGRKRSINDAFGGKVTTVEEQRLIWPDALHEDAIWEGPMFEKPVSFVGRVAVGHFFEFLLSVVPRFSTQLHAAYPTPDPETVIIESTGGGDTVFGGRYTQRYFSLITTKDSKTFRMRENCNPFETYTAFGRERWEQATAEIMAKYNVAWPASQKPDPCVIPPR